MSKRPLVGVIACRRMIEGHPSHMVTDKYLRALHDYGLAPLVLPVREDGVDTALLQRLDGMMLTGSYTNVEAHRYGAERAPDGLIEAFSVENARTFALAVQWHPEWRPEESAINDALFRGFAEACR